MTSIIIKRLDDHEIKKINDKLDIKAEQFIKRHDLKILCLKSLDGQRLSSVLTDHLDYAIYSKHDLSYAKYLNRLWLRIFDRVTGNHGGEYISYGSLCKQSKD